MNKASVAIRCGNNVWVSVLSAMPKDTISLRNFLTSVVSNGEKVRDLLTEDNGVYQIVLQHKDGVIRTEEAHLFLEKSFVEEARGHPVSACTFFVSYPSSKVTIGAAFLVTPVQVSGDDITTSQIKVRTTQDVYRQYQNAMRRLNLGAAGTAAFGVLLPALVGGVAIIPTVASAALALSGMGEITWQKIQERKQARMIVPDSSECELTALARTSPGLSAVLNAVGIITRKNNDELWVYGFPVEGSGEDISVVTPPSVTEMKTEGGKLLFWIGGGVSSNGKRALTAMTQDSELLVQSVKDSKARPPALRVVFPEMMPGVANSYFIDASRTV